jgi:hypothetical protein
VNTSLPVISGEPNANDTLAVTPGSWSGNTSGGFSYQWQRCDSGGLNCQPIANATSSAYALQGSDIGARIVAKVTALDGPTAVASAPTVVVRHPAPTGGTCWLVPNIGEADGTVFTVSCQNWFDYFQWDPLTYEFQVWGCDFNGENCVFEYANTPTTVPHLESIVSGYFNDDAAGGIFRAKVVICQSDGACTTWENIGYLADSGAPHNKPAAPPTISDNLWLGQTASVELGDWSNDPTSFSYQWYGDCVSYTNSYPWMARHNGAVEYGCNTLIDGATAATYALQPGDIGSVLLVEVTATNALGLTTVVYSPPSTAVAASAPAAAAPHWVGPTAGSDNEGEISFRASSDSATDSLQFFVDGVSVGFGVETATPDEYELNVNLDDFPLGDHLLKAVSSLDGVASVPSEITVTVVDTVSPQVDASDPVNGGAVNGVFTLTLLASDNRAPVSGDYSTDNGATWTAMTPASGGFSAEIDSGETFANGYVDFSLRVFDAAGNESSEFIISLLVSNPVQAPTPTISSPTADQVLTSSPMTVTVTTAHRADAVQIYYAYGLLGDAVAQNTAGTLWQADVDLSVYPDQTDFLLLAYAVNGHSGLETTVTVELDFLPEPVPTFVSPAADATVDGPFELEIATDQPTDMIRVYNYGYAHYFGDATYDLDSESWKLEIDPSVLEDGELVLKAVVYGPGGFSVGTLTLVNDSEHDTEIPVVQWLTPDSGTTVYEDFDLVFGANDNLDVTEGEFSSDDGVTWTAMDEVDSDTFAVSLSLDDYADGDYIFLVRARDAEGNVSVEAETNLTVSRRVDAELDTSSLEITGLVNETVTVGTTLTVGGATATGNPEPELTYQWNLCPQAGDCVTYDGNSYSPLESEIGWTVELEIRAYNGADGEPSSDVRFLGWVSAATVEEEEGGFGDPPADPAPAPTPVTPAPTPEPTPVDPTPAPEGRTVWGERSNPVKQVIVAANLDDVIRTGSGNDTIRSFGGNDTIFPGRGGDFVYAGVGNDVIWAQHGHAVIYCGPGTDRVYANRFVRTVGCETVIVANNNRWAQVKLNSKGFPIMPTGFVKPYFKG